MNETITTLPTAEGYISSTPGKGVKFYKRSTKAMPIKVDAEQQALEAMIRKWWTGPRDGHNAQTAIRSLRRLLHSRARLVYQRVAGVKTFTGAKDQLEAADDCKKIIQRGTP